METVALVTRAFPLARFPSPRLFQSHCMTGFRRALLSVINCSQEYNINKMLQYCLHGGGACNIVHNL